MDKILEALRALLVTRPVAENECGTWLSQDDVFDFLNSLAHSEWAILHSSFTGLFMHTVGVPTSELDPPDIEDLLAWGGNPSSSWGVAVDGGATAVTIEPPLSSFRSRTLATGEQLVFKRAFVGRHTNKSYFELSQRLAHTMNIHFVPERSAYCRLDEHGDLEDVVREFRYSDPRFDGYTASVIVARRDALDEYLALTHSAGVTMFDSTRFDPKDFGAWGDEPEVRRIDMTAEIFLRGRQRSNASYRRGFQVLRSNISNRSLIRRYKGIEDPDREYASFIALDFKHQKVSVVSSNPKLLASYFDDSDLPFETSPAFFRPEVLQRYKADSNKYQLNSRTISCRQTWHLETYDINEAGQVHTYLVYLSSLPYAEQLYWKAFNEAPKGPISDRAFKSDFEGNFATDYDPLLSPKNALANLSREGVRWWKLRSVNLPDRVHYPVTRSIDEWSSEIMALEQLVVEGFDEGELRRIAIQTGVSKSNPGSLNALEDSLLGLGLDPPKAKAIVAPLRELRRDRSKLKGHASGKDAIDIQGEALTDHGSFAAHFRNLCFCCDSSVRELSSIFKAVALTTGIE
jgi:hypothetical protein